MKLEFLICGSPNDAFFSQIAFFRLCLDALGGVYEDARLVAVFGDHSSEELPVRWKPYFKNIEVHWAHPVGIDNPGHLAQHYKRYDLVQSDSDLSILVDADTALLRPFPELIELCQSKSGLYGVIAHYHFPRDRFSDRDSKRDWDYLSEKILGYKIERLHRYTLLSKDSHERAPFYINYGFLAGPPDVMRMVGDKEREYQELAVNIIGEFYACQVALTLAVEDLGIKSTALSMRYNFPNDENSEVLHPEELKKVILVHYLRNNVFDRHKIFINREQFYRFINLPTVGVNKIFQEHVKNLTHCNYPFV